MSPDIDRLTPEQRSRAALADISEYIKYFYATETAILPAAISITLAGFDDLRTVPYTRATTPIFREALREAAALLASHALPLGPDDKERTRLQVDLADLGFFLEEGTVHEDFVL